MLHIHLVGIGGIGMSALAQHYLKSGFVVSGSDLSASKTTDYLQGLGINVVIGQHAAINVPSETKILVYSLAIIDQENPELVQARALGAKILSYPKALGEITEDFLTIAVAGSHGKTTTTAMIAKVLLDLDLDPTVILGSTAEFLTDGGNYRYGESGGILVLEACEYYGGFLELKPDIVVITNIEHDHFDAYPEEQAYLDAFADLAAKVVEGIYPVILNVDFPLAQKLYLDARHNQQFLTTGKDESCDYSLQNTDLELAVPGEHNRLNALAAVAVCDLLELERADVLKSLAEFKGTGRRLELKQTLGSVPIYSDYGHHPTEIMATLAALRERYPAPDFSLAIVYQAHQHHRTKALIDRFAKAFDLADEVVILPIYAARDSQELKTEITATYLVEEIAKYHKSVRVYDATVDEHLTSKLAEVNDVVVFMGAGDVESYGKF
jgi:UDP-N-acetylmuramate--alanine ligase